MAKVQSKKRVRWKDSQSSGTLFTYFYIENSVPIVSENDEEKLETEFDVVDQSKYIQKSGKEKNVKDLLGKRLNINDEDD